MQLVNGKKHLLGIAGMSQALVLNLLDNALELADVSDREIKKVPSLRGKTIINLFLEPSTRTRSSFEIAAKRLSADTINVGASDSSVLKGESLLDMAWTLQAMRPDVIVVRHKNSGSAQFLAQHLKQSSIVNAGDGMHEHPTQALLDALSLKQYYIERPQGITGLKVAIVGDIVHSRVARSNILLHQILGNQITLVAPPTLLPDDFALSYPGVQISNNLGEGLQDADVVIVLRMQLEREAGGFVPSLQEYSREFCVSEKILNLVAPNSVILHPGPINRGLEISGEVADGERSLIARQVTNGIAVRMAVLFELTTGQNVIADEDRGNG